MSVIAAQDAPPTTPMLVSVREAAARLGAVQRSMLRLGEMDSLWRVVAAAPREACRAVGVDRAMLSHVRDGTLRFAGATYEDDPQLAADFIRLARAAQPLLTDCRPEHEAAVRQEPVLVRGAQEATGVFRLLVTQSLTRAYAVVPIVCDGVTVGLLHADRFQPGTAEEVGHLDVALLSLFATGLSFAMRRFLSGQEPPSLTAAVDTAAAGAGAGLPDPSGALASLTHREREILALLADGASNARIGEVLVISEATVKTHVRHILRKLEAANRTEAVSRYHAGRAVATLGI